MKQTAVEWLYDLSKQRELDKFDWEQAKQIEKEQIIDAYHINPLSTKFGNIGIKYYNETYIEQINKNE